MSVDAMKEILEKFNVRELNGMQMTAGEAAFRQKLRQLFDAKMIDKNGNRIK